MNGNTTTHQPTLRLRQNVAVPMAGIIATVGASALATTRWWLAPLLAFPLAFTWWGLRSGIDVSPTGLRIRGAWRSRKLPWGALTGFTVTSGKVRAETDAGASMTLPAVTADDVPALLDAARSAQTADTLKL